MVEINYFLIQTTFSNPTWYAMSLGHAGVVELVDTPDLGSGAARCGGSSPFARRKNAGIAQR